MKPTIVQALFAAILLGGLMLKKPLLKPLFSAAWQLTDQGWHTLTFRVRHVFRRHGLSSNEIVWRTQSTDVWVNYKIFGAILLTLAFTASRGAIDHAAPDSS